MLRSVVHLSRSSDSRQAVHLARKSYNALLSNTFCTAHKRQESSLETHLNVLEIDDAISMDDASLTNEKLDSIFSKIRQSIIPKQDLDANTTQQSNALKFEDLFPLSSSSVHPDESQPETDEQEELELIAHEQPEAITDDLQASNSIGPESSQIDSTQSATHTEDAPITFMTEHDILSVPSSATVKQLLSTNDNTVENFGINLYHLLRYNPSGIMENDLKSAFYKHYGCQCPFPYQSAMIKHIIASCSHLFIIKSDMLGRKILFYRPNIENEKYLNLDSMPHLKQCQLFHYLLTHNQKNTLSPTSNLELMQNHQTNPAIRDQLIKISELQSEFHRHFHGLFVCDNLYKTVNKIGSIRKICSGFGEITDYYLMWSCVEEELAGMNLLFKLWHILNQYPNGLKWNQLQKQYCTQYGELLLFPEHYFLKRKVWRILFKVEENPHNKQTQRLYKIADPSLSDGKMMLIDIHSDNATSTLAYQVVNHYLAIQAVQQKRYFFHDIVPLRTATVDDNVWKFIVFFTRTKHADYFYHRAHDTRLNEQNVESLRGQVTVSRFSVHKLKKFLDSIIPHSLPFSLSVNPESELWSNPVASGKYASPLPFQLPVSDGSNMIINVDEDEQQSMVHTTDTLPSSKPVEPAKSALEEYIELRKQPENQPFSIPTAKSFVIEEKEKKEHMASPDAIKSLWGLLTHYPDGLTLEQLTYLYNKYKQTDKIQPKWRQLHAPQIEEILHTTKAWFVSQPQPNGSTRWYHSSIYDLTNKTIVVKPEKFLLFEYLENYINNLNIGEITSTTRHRSDLLVHFKDEVSAETMLKMPDLMYNNIRIQTEDFCPRYSYSDILPAAARPVGSAPHFVQRLTAELAKHPSLSCTQLYNMFSGEPDLLHSKIQNPIQLARVLMDAYSPYVHMVNRSERDSEFFGNVGDISLHSYRRPPRRTPRDMAPGLYTNTSKFKRYYNDIREFFDAYPNGITLSQFRREFVRIFQYFPQVPSLSGFLKSCDVFTFYMNNASGEEVVDLYLLPIPRYDANVMNACQYPSNGMVLEGFPYQTSNEALTKMMSENIGPNYVLKRGLDRFVVWYDSPQLAQNAMSSFMADSVRKEGIRVINDIPSLCDNVLTWIDSKCVYT